MARKSDLQKAHDAIVDYFATAGPKVYRQKDINNIFDNLKTEWQLGEGTRLSKFIHFITESIPLQQVKLSFPNRPETRYVYGDCSIYSIAQSIKENGYFSHKSAAEIHGLLGPGNQIYFNCEQALPSQSSGEITQDAIDRAFQRKARITQNKADYERYTIWMLNGKNTGFYRVIQYTNKNGDVLQVTDRVRTLFDMAVRPAYSGGPIQVLQAYRKALGMVNGAVLAETVIAMKHTYPYHQAIGFYLERAGFSEEHLEPLRRIQMKFNFYLDNQIAKPLYSSDWQLFYPAIMDKAYE